MFFAAVVKATRADVAPLPFVALTQAPPSSAQTLLKLIEPFRSGTCPITINYQNGATGGEIELGSDWRVNLEDHLLDALRASFKPENIQVVY